MIHQIANNQRSEGMLIKEKNVSNLIKGVSVCSAAGVLSLLTAAWLHWMTFKGPFQPKPFRDWCCEGSALPWERSVLSHAAGAQRWAQPLRGGQASPLHSSISFCTWNKTWRNTPEIEPGRQSIRFTCQAQAFLVFFPCPFCYCCNRYREKRCMIQLARSLNIAGLLKLAPPKCKWCC